MPQNTQGQGLPMQPPAQTTYAAPPQTSPPPKTTPTKTTIKALPTVRDHTTDQLGPGGDEYIPREVDDAGEKKVTANGNLLGGRDYRCRTFFVPNRGEKLFMLATECARVLGYRDSYLLFNKNRSLYKIIASQEEKDDLVAQDILPFSYRSRQIAIVTARSMFRQFGSRVIVNGRRVRDDYWESKARKQGFTEEDLAGEKRPGAAKARAAEAANAASLLGAPHQIVYSTNPSQFGEPPQPQIVQPGMIGAPSGSATKMPMITLGPDLNDRSRDYSNLLKGGPRQEITGPPYHDRTQPAPMTEIQQQATQAAEYNRSVNQGRDMRSEYMQTIWRRPHEQAASPATLPQPIGSTDSNLPATTSRAGPSSSAMAPQPGMISSHSPQLMMTGAPYSQPIHSQASQPSMRGMAQPSSQKNQRPTSMSGAAGSISSGYNYAPSGGQMWAPQHQQPQTPQHSYNATYTTQQGQASSPHPPQAATPQMRSAAQVQPPMQFSGMPGMSQNYGTPGQNMYPADHQTPRQYMPSAPSGSPAVTQAWSNSQPTPGSWWATSQPQ
ncbi:uncharacterized protein MKZ38_008633 [Zalerion maritima]|uniref:Uncharacterized protein n=1 Tax=Zalerion maritima TaxID=339359 RepID=A0AAD5S0M3_9PEZI|nr:uncharacterized protein MKZ38_008633 [Zalerion maritima]